MCAVILSMAAFGAVAEQVGDEKIQIDSTVRVGRLDNGMTYYIKHAENPAQRADFFIAHNVGALQEEDNQNGLAHFLEHMAFNGTKNFPAKNLLNYLAANGVRFGYNVNAYTSRDRTVYNVSNVPLVRDGLVDSLLLIMHDWSYYISCEPAEIEAERGVIREEWRRGDDSRSRMAKKTAKIEYAGSKYAQRDVIGDPNIINTFERQTLVDFYHKWYRPDMQAVIVVGDVDLDRMEQKIKATMSGIPKAVNPAPKEIYTLPETDEMRYGVITDPETKMSSVKLIFRQPYPSLEERATTVAVRNDLMRKVFAEMVRVRLAAAEKQSDARYKRAVAVTASLLTCKNTYLITALPHEERLREALTGLFLNVEQIRRYGFGEAEFEQAKSRVLRAEKQQIEKMRLATNTELAGVYVEHFTRNVPYATPDERLRVVESQLGALTLPVMNEWSPSMLERAGMLVLFSTPENKPVPAEADVRALADSVANAKIEEPAGLVKAVTPFFTQTLTAGKIVKSRKAPYDAEEWTLSNGAKIYWRTLPEVTGSQKIAVNAVNRGGFARSNDFEAMRLLQGYIRSMAVRDYDKVQMRDQLSQHNTRASATLNRNSAVITAAASRSEFEFMLQAVRLYITDPNFGQPYTEYVEEQMRSLNRGLSQRAIYNRRSDSIAYAGHPWLAQPTRALYERLDGRKARELYDLLFGNVSDYTFFFAGEISAAQARPLIEKYIGSLPAAPRQKFREQDFELAAGIRDFEYVDTTAVTPKSNIERTYHGKFKCTPANYATMRYLTYILGARYMSTVREEKGGTYHIGVQNEIGARPYGYCHVLVKFDTAPNLSAMLLEEVQKGFELLAAEAPSEQEVTQARLYFEKVNAERKSQNQKSIGYWIGKMQGLAIDGVDLEGDNPAYFAAVTANQIKELAHSILSQQNRFTTIFTQQ